MVFTFPDLREYGLNQLINLCRVLTVFFKQKHRDSGKKAFAASNESE